jgi:hypothetical protein
MGILLFFPFCFKHSKNTTNFLQFPAEQFGCPQWAFELDAIQVFSDNTGAREK